MGLFSIIEGDTAIVRNAGVFKQVPIYARDGYLYAGISSNAFVRLYCDGSTSKANLRLDHLDTTQQLYRDSFGRLGTKRITGAEKISPTELPKLLSAV